MPEIQRTDPPYMQVVAEIRDRIKSGQLREGDHVPSARQISRDWGVAIATATKVLAALRSEGLARGVPGIGTVVTASGRGPRDRLAAIQQTGRIYGPDERAEIKEAGLTDAPQQVTDALGLAPGTRVIRRRRITYRDDRPTSASTSWYDGTLADAAPKLLEASRIKEGTPRYIEATTGRRIVSGRDQVGARPATEQDAEDLGVEPGTAVLHGRNWYLDEQGDVVEYGEYASEGDRLRSYEYLMGSG